MDPIYRYGPYVHGLNKGGLREIILSSKLRGAAASNHMAHDRIAVRAYEGAFEYHQQNKRWSGRDKIYIEFFTMLPPRTGTPPREAEWTGPQLINDHLDVKISRVVYGSGEQVDQY